MAADGVRIDAAHLAGEREIDAVAYAHRARGDEVARCDAHTGAVHGRVGESHGKQRFHLRAHGPAGVDDGVERAGVGHADPVHELRLPAAELQAILDLRSDAVHNNELHAEAVQQRHVVHQGRELGLQERVALELNDEYAPPVSVDIGCGATKSAYEGRLVAHGRYVRRRPDPGR